MRTQSFHHAGFAKPVPWSQPWSAYELDRSDGFARDAGRRTMARTVRERSSRLTGKGELDNLVTKFACSSSISTARWSAFRTSPWITERSSSKRVV